MRRYRIFSAPLCRFREAHPLNRFLSLNWQSVESDLELTSSASSSRREIRSSGTQEMIIDFHTHLLIKEMLTPTHLVFLEKTNPAFFSRIGEYAESPQLTRYTNQTGEASLRTKSLTYIAREFARLMIRDVRAGMREQSVQRVSTRTRVRSHYDLRLSDDKFVVRMKYRF